MWIPLDISSFYQDFFPLAQHLCNSTSGILSSEVGAGALSWCSFHGYKFLCFCMKRFTRNSKYSILIVRLSGKTSWYTMLLKFSTRQSIICLSNPACIKYENACSEITKIRAGVLQGIVLAHFLYLLNINDRPNEKNCTICG